MKRYALVDERGRVVGATKNTAQGAAVRSLASAVLAIEIDQDVDPEGSFAPGDGSIQKCSPSPISAQGATLAQVPTPSDILIGGQFVGANDEATVELDFAEPKRYFVRVIPHNPSIAIWSGVVDAR